MTNLYAHLNLAIRAPRRLAILKKSFADALAKYPQHRAKSWRDVRYATFDSCDGQSLHQGLNGKEPIWYSQGGEQFRREWFCDEVPDGPRINHTGWFCDPDQDSKARGIVALLPHGRFIAGLVYTMNDERVYYGTLYDTARDAALSADASARVYAEEESAYQEKWQAARALEEDNETCFQRLRECLALRNNPCFAALRDEARELMETIRANRETLATEYKGVL